MNTPHDQATTYLHRYWDQTFPVDPVKIATSAGVAVYGLGAEHGFAYSGRYRVIEGRPIIEYNTTEGTIRQRFTVAHALGHYACGHIDPPAEQGPFYANTNPQEVRATAFARELIIPRAALTTYYTEGRFSTVEQMAQFFGVSVDAMAYRLIHLGLA